MRSSPGAGTAAFLFRDLIPLRAGPAALASLLLGGSLSVRALSEVGVALFGGYLFGAALMLAAAAVMLRFGVAAERRPLEEVSRPLSMID